MRRFETLRTQSYDLFPVEFSQSPSAGEARVSWDIYVYMLRCADKSYYVGITRGGLDKRIREHDCGRYPKCYTFKRRPVELVWWEDFRSLRDAIACERRLKRWRRAKKEALIAGDFALISKLSRTAPHPSTGSG